MPSSSVPSFFALTWGTDIGAYFTGRTIGGPKIAPKISPKKTWAGLFGGMACAAVIASAIYSYVSIPSVSLNAVIATIAFVSDGVHGSLAWAAPGAAAGTAMAAAVGAVLAVWAQFGDFVESGIKRHFNVKDSGRLIPGHGGLLDRVDGLLFVAPLVLAMGFAPNLIGAFTGMVH